LQTDLPLPVPRRTWICALPTGQRVGAITEA
jgi:hypothetical protein